jgi:hypothetical protein
MNWIVGGVLVVSVPGAVATGSKASSKQNGVFCYSKKLLDPVAIRFIGSTDTLTFAAKTRGNQVLNQALSSFASVHGIPTHKGDLNHGK